MRVSGCQDTMKPTIRSATLGDSSCLFALVSEFATSFVPEKLAFDISLKGIVSDESASLEVAEYLGEAVGYCLGFDHFAFYANGHVSWVEEIIVRSEYRRHGIGRSLMESFERWCMKRNSRLVGLATRRAAPFYQAMGYEESAVFLRKLLTTQDPDDQRIQPTRSRG